MYIIYYCECRLIPAMRKSVAGNAKMTAKRFNHDGYLIGKMKKGIFFPFNFYVESNFPFNVHG